MNDRKANSARARFFLGVAQAGSQWRDENTLPLFPLLLVMGAEMLEADARYEASRGTVNATARARSGYPTEESEGKR